MPSAGADPLVGQLILGRYRVLGKLGDGGMGAVYLAEQMSIHRRVALKMLHAVYARDEEFVRRFRQEARVVASLSNRYIQTVYDFDQAEGGSLFMAMEYLQGPTLSDVIRTDGALSLERAARLGQQICEGLGVAHRAGVIHRDIKPSNVMIVGDPEEARLLDFGIARLRDAGDTRLTQPSTLMGTPEYMAPEQIEGHEVTEQTDIYALGVMLYQMLTGTVPFRAPTPGAVLAKHLQEQPRPLRALRGEIPQRIEAVVSRALEKEPERRPRTVSEIAETLGVLISRRRSIDETPPMGERDWERTQTMVVSSDDTVAFSGDGSIVRRRGRRISRRVTIAIALVVGIGTGILATWSLVGKRVTVTPPSASRPVAVAPSAPAERDVAPVAPRPVEPAAVVSPPAPSTPVEPPAPPAPPARPAVASPPAGRPSGAVGREKAGGGAERPSARPTSPPRSDPSRPAPSGAPVSPPSGPTERPPQDQPVVVTRPAPDPRPPEAPPPSPPAPARPPAPVVVTPDPAGLSQEVTRALRARGFSNVKAEVSSEGVALLTGSVAGGERARQEAIDTARRVSGVKDVRASLFVWDAPAAGR